ncbi:MAG: type II toxin-antitoxin system RelE/ParE family toxin [Chthoniobacterales bacterium]
MEIEVLPSAQKDLKTGRFFYERQQTGLGKYFFKTLELEIDSLEFFAGIHVRRGELFRFKSKKFPYLIYYGMTREVVYVSAVLDARRSPFRIHAREQREQARMRLLP